MSSPFAIGGNDQILRGLPYEALTCNLFVIYEATLNIWGRGWGWGGMKSVFAFNLEIHVYQKPSSIGLVPP